jgi:hypothetical protein
MAAGLVILGGVAFLLGERIKTVKAPPIPALAAPPGSPVRILAGLAEGTYTDGYNKVWLSDRYFQGGAVVSLTNHPIWGTRDPRLYQSRRQGVFQYDIPAKPGTYELRLYFAETHFGESNAAGFGGENTRYFAISINGVAVKPRFDVAGEAGVNVAMVKVFRDVTPASDGFVHVAFSRLNSDPFVNAVELTPGVPGRLVPIRLVEQPLGYTDSSGQTWAPDRLAVGGQLVARTPDVSEAPDGRLYAGERFGNLSYTIAVPPGKYALVLHMSERWLGPGQPGGGSGTGSRLFDILCNGVALERNFDIFARAGGANRALSRTYHGIEPNHQGNIVLSLLPIKNFASLNALEVLDEAK